MQIQTTRRALLRMGTSAAACSALIGGADTAFAVASRPETLTTGLATLFERHRSADTALTHFYKTVLNPAVEAHNRAVSEHRAAAAAVPHVEAFGPPSIGGPPVTFSSRKGYSRSQADSYVKHGNKPDEGAPWNETVDAARRFIKLDDERNAVIATLGPPPEEDPAFDAQEAAACVPLEVVREQIRAFPVRTLADLHAKLAWIEQDDGMDGEDLLPLVIADVARLAQGGLS